MIRFTVQHMRSFGYMNDMHIRTLDCIGVDMLLSLVNIIVNDSLWNVELDYIKVKSEKITENVGVKNG